MAVIHKNALILVQLSMSLYQHEETLTPYAPKYQARSEPRDRPA